MWVLILTLVSQPNGTPAVTSIKFADREAAQAAADDWLEGIATLNAARSANARFAAAVNIMPKASPVKNNGVDLLECYRKSFASSSSATTYGLSDFDYSPEAPEEDEEVAEWNSRCNWNKE